MLYVFQVDTGMMMTFEMELAMSKVSSLKKAIAMNTDIPEEKQVLLISGGESLHNTQRVCSYSSGTDTSPIFLFAKVNIESNQPPLPNVDYGDDTDMTEMIESCVSMQPSLDTLVARTELAADLNEQATRQKKVCERLVHDQHLQQQGWAAVTANLDDLTRALKNKAEMLMAAFEEFTKCKPNHKILLNKFEEDIKQLDGIPILHILIENNKLISSPSTSVKGIGGVSERISPHQGSTSQRKSSANKHSAKSRSTDIAKHKAQSSSVIDTSSESTSKGADNSGSLKSSIVSSNALNKTSQTSSEIAGLVEEKDHNLDVETEEKSKTRAKGVRNNSNQQDSKAAKSHGRIVKKGEVDENEDEDDKFLDVEDPEGEQRTQSSSASGAGTTSDDKVMTLRQWIDYHDSHNSLERLIELCWRGLERFTEANAEQIKSEVQELLKHASSNNMKEIKGLEDRLFGLEKLMLDASKVVDEQSQLAASFWNNRERFSKIKDSTLLPDLSASHKQQLQMMLANHKKMSDYRNRCIKAKHELSVNLHARLKWIMYIEQQISDLDGKLMIYKENLMRLNKHFDIVSQVHRSPDLYLEAVIEALRRRRFSRRYLHWANSIAKISRELYESEVTARKEFDAKLGTHFLSNLFPGLTKSFPPQFANVQPDPFDTNLPRITVADVRYLQANLSDELSAKLQIPKDVPMPHLISAPSALDDSLQEQYEDLDDRQSLNPTPPSSPTRPQQYDD